MIEANIQIIGELKEFIRYVLNDKELRKIIIPKANDFTRDRNLTVEKLALFLINMSRKTLSVELHEFFEILGKSEKRCTKSAFTQQRKKLSYLFFKGWNINLRDSFYYYYSEKLVLWNGFRLIGVDGSTFYLPQTKEILEYFGTQENQYGGKAMARALFVYDVLNEISIHNEIHPIKTSESAILCDLITLLPYDSIAIYDRGFPSFKNMFLHIYQEKAKLFVMRCSLTQNKAVIDFVKSGKRSAIVELHPNKDAKNQLWELGYKVFENTTIKIRFIRIELDNGDIEILATNLYDSIKYPTSQFKSLYFHRWKVETGINYIKNLYQIELFSGRSVESVKQDFYATMFTFNLHSILIKQCDLKLKMKDKETKYEYKINRTVTLGFIKGDLLLLFINSNPKEILIKMQNEFSKETIPIRDGRKYERTKKVRRLNGKYQSLTNYKRAI